MFHFQENATLDEKTVQKSIEYQLFNDLYLKFVIFATQSSILPKVIPNLILITEIPKEKIPRWKL